MPRNLEPNQIWLPTKLTRGALVTLPDPKAKSQQVEVLRFQYNPETITRSRTGQWEHRLDKKGKLSDAQKKTEMDAHRGGGLKSKSETISMKLMFDATELALRAGGFDQGDATTGVLPELAALERLALGPDQVPEPKKDDSEFPLISLNPTEVLLVFGDRQFPAVVTSVNIVEQRFAANLVPIRAEVEIRLRVLEATKSATNKVVEKAFTDLLAARERNAAIAVYTDTRGDVAAALSSALLGSDRDNSNANVNILFANNTSKPIGG